MPIANPALHLLPSYHWGWLRDRYGYSYPCLPGTAADAEFCPIAEVPFRGVNCTDAAGHERPYAAIMAQLSQGNRTTDIRWDTSTQSPYFNYKGADGSIHQQWFDNPRYVNQHVLLVRFHIIGNARISKVCKYQSCMVSTLPIIWKQTALRNLFNASLLMSH